MKLCVRDPFLLAMVIAYIYVVYDLTGILFDKQTDTIEKGWVNNREINYVNHPVYDKDRDDKDIFFDCTNIDLIGIVDEMEQSDNEQIFLGEYQGSSYIVKMVTSRTNAVSQCLSRVKENTFTTDALKEKCYGHAIMNNMKEILIHHEIWHSNISPLVGYCVRNKNFYTSDLKYHGVISVFQSGEEISVATKSAQSWQERLQHAHELSLLLLYLENSPIGSILYPNMNISDFQMIDGKLKLRNMGGVMASEPLCQNGILCEGGAICFQGKCAGFNAQSNLLNMCENLIIPLLSDAVFPANITNIITAIKSDLENRLLNAPSLVNVLESLCKIIQAS